MISPSVLIYLIRYHTTRVRHTEQYSGCLCDGGWCPHSCSSRPSCHWLQTQEVSPDAHIQQTERQPGQLLFASPPSYYVTLRRGKRGKDQFYTSSCSWTFCNLSSWNSVLHFSSWKLLLEEFLDLCCLFSIFLTTPESDKLCLSMGTVRIPWGGLADLSVKISCDLWTWKENENPERRVPVNSPEWEFWLQKFPFLFSVKENSQSLRWAS